MIILEQILRLTQNEGLPLSPFLQSFQTRSLTFDNTKKQLPLAFSASDSLLKMLYLAMIDITKKWTGKRKDWGQIHSQLEIFFADRLPQ